MQSSYRVPALAGNQVQPAAIPAGATIIYNREIPFEVRHVSNHNEPQQGALVGMNVTIATEGGDGATIKSIYVELSSDDDVFASYSSIVHHPGYKPANSPAHAINFNLLREKQKLFAQFPDFCDLLVTTFNSCLPEGQDDPFFAVLLAQGDGQVILQFIRSLEQSKFVEMLSLPFVEASPEDLWADLNNRHAQLRMQLDSALAREAPQRQDKINRAAMQLEEADPSLADGFRLAYLREVPCEIRFPPSATDQPNKVVRGIDVKIVTQTEPGAALPMTARVELTNPDDFYMHYSFLMNYLGFDALKVHQNLSCNFEEFPQLLRKRFNEAVEDPSKYLFVFQFSGNGEGTLFFVQNMKYKYVELLSLPFVESTEDIIRESANFRHNLVRSKLQMLHM